MTKNCHSSRKCGVKNNGVFKKVILKVMIGVVWH